MQLHCVCFGIEARALVACPPGCRGHAIMELAIPSSYIPVLWAPSPKRFAYQTCKALSEHPTPVI